MEIAFAQTLLILALLLGVLAAALLVGFAALRRGEPSRRQSEGIGKVVVGPTLLDGVWCRLVAYEDGYRRVEVLGPSGWTPSHRDVAHLMQAIPGRSMGDGKRAEPRGLQVGPSPRITRRAVLRPKAIDCWLNPSFRASDYRPEFLVRVAREYFHREQEIFEVTPLETLLRQMDEAGIERAILTIDPHDPEPYREVRKAFPGRFILSAMFDPTKGMDTVRLLERVVTEHDVRLARVTPFLVNRPPNDKVYYPLYTKCIELGVPVSINTGIPGPPMPAEPQRPLYLDEVCLFFPELVVVMAHGADPWWGEAIRLLLKYPNLYMMTSAYAPKYLPQELIQFMNTRGQGKVLFASDHPVLSFERCVTEAAALPFREGVLERYLRGNALSVFRWD